MSASARVQKLKLLIGGLTEPQPRDIIHAPEILNGIPRGIIVELMGSQRTEWLVQLLKLYPEARTFWSEEEQRILPTSLHQRGIDLTKITFGVVRGDAVTTLRRVIQSQLYQFVIAPNTFTEIKIFQAFQLFTEKSNSILFLMGDKTPSTAWPISLQLDISKSQKENDRETQGKNFEIEILKQKHGLN